MKFFVAQIYTGRATQPVIELFSKLVKEGLNEFINNRINLRLKSALSQPQAKTPLPEPINAPEEKQDIVTTKEEIDGFLIVKAIARQVIKLDRIVMRDTKSYCGVLLDDNNRKPICRLHFNASKKYIEIGRSGERIQITEVDDIYQYSDQILKAIEEYEKAGES